MKWIVPYSRINRRALLSTMAVLPALPGTLLPASTSAQTAMSGGLLPSWNEGPAKKAIFDFIRATIDRSSPSYGHVYSGALRRGEQERLDGDQYEERLEANFRFRVAAKRIRMRIRGDRCH
jgi:hypothetical protein